MQQLAQLLSSALLSKDSPATQTQNQTWHAQDCQIWKGHRYKVDPTTGCGLGLVLPTKVRACEFRQRPTAARQIDLEHQPFKPPKLVLKEGLDRSYHKITFLRKTDWAPMVVPSLVSYGKLEQGRS